MRTLMMLPFVCLISVTLAGTATAKKRPASLILVTKVQEGEPEVTNIRHRGAALPGRLLNKRLEKLGFRVGVAAFSPELTMDYLRQFNLIVIGAGGEGNQSIRYAPDDELVKEKKRLVLEYVKQGGGLLVLRCPGWQFGKDIDETNDLLKPCGVEILPEQMVDEENVIKLDSGARLFWTNNLIQHPVTEGVKGIFYPDIYRAYGKYTDFSSPIKVSKEWKVLLYGMKTAKSMRTVKGGAAKPPSPGTFKNSPPFLAVREYGKGRIAVCPVASTTVWQDGYHIFWGRGLSMDGEAGGMKGDAARLLVNLFTYLSKPSKDVFGGYVPKKIEMPVEVGFRKIDWDKRQIKGVLVPDCYIGLIGAKTSLSSGKGKPEEFISAAKKAGYDFIGFTEEISKLTPEKFEDLKEICRKNSDENFKAYPGFFYLDESGNSWVTFSHILTWPKKAWWSKKHPDRLEVNNALSRGWGWPPVILIKSHKNPEKPWHQGNFRMFSIYTYENGKLVDDSLDHYLRLQRQWFNLTPVAVHLVDSPEEVARARENGFQTYVRWFDGNMVDAITGRPMYKDIRVYYRSSFISEGPVLEDSRILNMGMSDLAIPKNDRFRMHIKASSDTGLKEVLIMDYDEPAPWRRFLPGGKKEFEISIDHFHEKQHNFVVMLTDVNGKKAVGWPNWTCVQENAFLRCSDNFNTMPRGKWWGEPEGLHNLRGIENYLVVRNFMYCGLPGFSGLEETSRPAVEYYPYLASRFGSIIDCIVEDHYPLTASGNHDRTDIPECSVPNKYVTGEVRYTFFTCWQDSPFILLVEGNFTAKKSFTAKSRNVFGAHGRSGADMVCAVKEDGRPVGVKLTEKTSRSQGVLPQNGFVALFPSAYRGSLGVISLQPGLKYIAHTSTRKGQSYESLRVKLVAKDADIKEGEKITYRYLGVISELDPPTDSAFITNICDTLGIGGEPAYTMKPARGAVESTYYILKLKADGYGFSGKISQTKLPINLPVQISGLNPRWDAGIWYRGMNALVIAEWVVNEFGQRYTVRKRRSGKNQLMRFPVVEDGTGMLQVDTEVMSKDIYIGNLVVSDNQDVCLTLVDTRPGKAAIVAHNPTDKEIMCSVKNGPGFTLLGKFSKKVTIPAGSSVRYLL